MPSDSLITSFDHAVILLSDPQAAGDIYEKLGFLVTDLNHHAEAGTANRVMSFRNEYLELVGVMKATPQSQQMVDIHSVTGDGLRMLALSTDDAVAVQNVLTEKGIPAFGPFELGRKAISQNGEEVEARFKVSFPLPVASPYDANMFACEHETPELSYSDDRPAHPNGATGMCMIEAPSENLEALVPLLTAFFGEGKFQISADRIEVKTGSFPLIFIQKKAWPHGNATGRIVFTSEDIDKSRSYFANAGIPFTETGGGIRIAAADACMVLLEFQA